MKTTSNTFKNDKFSEYDMKTVRPSNKKDMRKARPSNKKARQSKKPDTDKDIKPDTDKDIKLDTDKDIKPDTDKDIKPDTDKDIKPDTDKKDSIRNKKNNIRILNRINTNLSKPLKNACYRFWRDSVQQKY